MPIYARYLTRRLALPTLLVTLALTGALWLTQSLRFVDLVVNKGLPVAALLELTGLLLPHLLLQILPLSIFVGAVSALRRLDTESELTALRAAGVSQGRIVGTCIGFAALVAALCYGISLFALPVSYGAYKDLKTRLQSEIDVGALRPGAFRAIADGITLYVDRRGPDGGLAGVMIQDDRDPDVAVTITAEQGWVAREPAGARLVLVNGVRQTRDATGDVSRLHFDRLVFDPQAHATTGSRWREANERFVTELFGAAGDEAEAGRLRAAAHWRLAWPAAPVTFMLLALAAAFAGAGPGISRRSAVTLASIGVLGLQAAALGLKSLSGSAPGLAVGQYALILLPACGALWIALRATPQRKGRAVAARPEASGAGAR